MSECLKERCRHPDHDNTRDAADEQIDALRAELERLKGEHWKTRETFVALHRDYTAAEARAERYRKALEAIDEIPNLDLKARDLIFEALELVDAPRSGPCQHPRADTSGPVGIGHCPDCGLVFRT